MSEKFLLSSEIFWQDAGRPLGSGPLQGANPVEFRTLVALAATMVFAAVAANATSPVQTAREHEPAPLPASFDDWAGPVPESPLAIASPLAGDHALEIQLGAADPDPEPRSVSLPELPLEVSPN
jgi:hypothetical protein